MESKPPSKKISKAKNNLEQNYQHINKTQCSNRDTLKKIANVYIIIVVGVGFFFFFLSFYLLIEDKKKSS